MTKKKMGTVCIISTAHGLDDHRVVHKQAKSAANAGWHVKYIVHTNENVSYSDIKIDSLGVIDSRLERFGHIPSAFWKAYNTNADVYHIHDPELLPVGYALSKLTDGSVIFDMHEDYIYYSIKSREWIPSTFRPVLAKAFPSVLSWHIKRIDCTIATTESVAEGVRKLGANNVVTIHNYPRTEDLEIKPLSVSPNHEFLLVYVGLLEKKRGIIRMIQVLKRLRDQNIDVGLWLLGPECDRVNTGPLIKKHNLEEHVSLFGYIPHNQIMSYISEADLGLALLDKDLCEHNLPTKLLEYMYAEIPVVATDAQTIRNHVDESCASLVPEDDITLITNSIKDILHDRELMDEMGSEGKKKILTSYNWGQESKKLKEVYACIK